MAGLPATGKSAISCRLKQELACVLLDKDQIRACLFAEHVEYSREQDDLCVNAMYEVARYHLQRRPASPVILDGRTYSRRYQIAAVKTAAEHANVPICFIECVCSPETARHRINLSKGAHIAKDRDEILYEKSRAAAEPITEHRLILNTDKNTKDQCIQTALAYIKKQLEC